MKQFFEILFSFIRENRIHSFADHMSNYSPLWNTLLESHLIEFRYNPRFDSYSFRLENPDNQITQSLFLFTFGNGTEEQQLMISVNNSRISVELAIHSEKAIPPIIYLPAKKTLFSSLPPKTEHREIMGLDEWESFLKKNRFQKGRTIK